MCFFNVLKKYNVEPIIFFYMIGKMILVTPYTQLIQDKICLFEYNYDDAFCREIQNTTHMATDEAHQVLRKASNMIMFGTLITSLPAVIAAVFLGPWLDMYLIAPKIVLCLTLFSGLIESLLLIINIYFFQASSIWVILAHVPNGITGGSMMALTAVFTIAMKETELSSRTLRFTILELAIVTPSSIANSISSKLLQLQPWIVPEQTINFMSITIVSCFSYLIAILLTFCMLGKVKEIISANDNPIRRAAIRSSLQPLSTEYLIISNNEIKDKNSLSVISGKTDNEYLNYAFENDKTDPTQSKTCSTGNNNNLSFFNQVGFDKKRLSLPSHVNLETKQAKVPKSEMCRSIFRFKNMTAMVKSAIKQRPNKLHLQIWAVFVLYVIILITTNGIPFILLQFSERVYGWNSSKFLKADAIGHLASGLMSTFSLLLLHKINLTDTKIILIGIISAFLSNLLKGVYASPVGLYLSFLFGSVYLAGVVGCRALVAKLVPGNELGTVMGVLSVLYASTPTLGSLFYTQIFAFSINFYPGLAFVAAATLLTFAFLITLWLDHKARKYQKVIAS